MVKTMAFLILFVGVVSTCLAQEPITDGPRRNTYVHNRMRLVNRDILRIVSDNEEAYQLVKNGQTLKGVGSVSLVLGLGMFGWVVGQINDGHDVSLPLIGAGLGFTTVAIALKIGGNAMIKSGVDRYNQGLEAKVMSQKPRFDLAFTGTGLGLRMTF